MKSRQRTPEQKRTLAELACFWTKDENMVRAVRPPWRHQLGNSGAIEVSWFGYKPEHRALGTGPDALGIMLDWCDDHELPFKFHKFHQLPDYITVRAYAFRRTGPSSQFMLTVFIPGGVPKHKRPMRLSNTGEDT